MSNYIKIFDTILRQVQQVSVTNLSDLEKIKYKFQNLN